MLWASSAAFLTYSFMYAYRKPITAASFENLYLLGMSYKVVLVITQLLGYLTSKLIGVKYIAELKGENRRRSLLVLIACALMSLFLFAITPYPYGFIWLFFNGLPLGMIWGIVYSYIEGRTITDFLALFLSISFIFSSGIVKSLGRYLIEVLHVSEFWMPLSIGSLFVIPIIISSWVLDQLPAPDAIDKEFRVERVPLNQSGRRTILKKFGFGIFLLLLFNGMLTICRDIKDNFMIEIWQSLGISSKPSIYAQIESLVSLIVIVLLMGMVLIKNNKKAIAIITAIMIAGMCAVLISTYIFSIGKLGGYEWMVIHGIGLYLSYICFQSIYFERWIAALGINGNVGFFIYMADFVGYLGSTVVMILKEFGVLSANWKIFFIQLNFVIGGIALLSIFISFIYFNTQSKIKTELV